MIFVDTNVFMYAVGRTHPLREAAREFFENCLDEPRQRLCTSAEVLQELLHAYLPVQRLGTLDAALHLARSCTDEIWPIETEDVLLARKLCDRLPALSARDLLHLGCCQRRGARAIKPFDRALASVLLPVR